MRTTRLKDRFTDLHFTAQHESAADLEPVGIDRLDPFLRALLFTDGTVSRTLEANTLAPVTIATVEQSDRRPPARIARHLRLRPGTEGCVRRRVTMSAAGTDLAVWAESYVIPQRLPAEFLALSRGNSLGIGGSLQKLKLESWRELLWYGLGSPPSWCARDTTATTTLTRFYRVITQALPALLISEAFAVEQRLGFYRLAGACEPTGQWNGERLRRRPPAVGAPVGGEDTASPAA